MDCCMKLTVISLIDNDNNYCFSITKNKYAKKIINIQILF